MNAYPNLYCESDKTVSHESISSQTREACKELEYLVYAWLPSITRSPIQLFKAVFHCSRFARAGGADVHASTFAIGV